VVGVRTRAVKLVRMLKKTNNCSDFSDGCPIDGEHCDDFLNCQDCGEFDQCGWCSWNADKKEERKCSLVGTWKDIPSSATCKAHCNGVTLRKPKLSRGAVAGIVIGVLFGALLAIAGVTFIYSDMNRDRKSVL